MYVDVHLFCGGSFSQSSFFVQPPYSWYMLSRFSTVATANSPGYTEIFTPDYLTTNEKFYIMQTEGFVSEKTRAIFLEFTIYNFNLGLQLESPAEEWKTHNYWQVNLDSHHHCFCDLFLWKLRPILLKLHHPYCIIYLNLSIIYLHVMILHK